ncbi:MAG: hypothetical protein KTR18_01100 [Acidiferrobacterales bacterium]|nr:hypothetical protein [Acidiferrobacterales bacterium]
MKKRFASLLGPRAAALLLFWSSCVLATQDAAVSEAREFVQRAHLCGLDHGYQCSEPVESDFIGLDADRAMVPGSYLAAWQVALEAFRSIEDLSSGEKQLQHYKIGFSENETQYVVHFQALLLPSMSEGEPSGIMRGTFGRTTRYWINKDSMKVEKRLYYK